MIPAENFLSPEIVARLGCDDVRLSAFCARWRVARLDLFGSVLRDDFRPDSDIDVLVSFLPDADWGLFEHAAMEDELAQLFGRSVDLITRRAVERSANQIRRAAILKGAVPLFASAQSPEAVIPQGRGHVMP